jgi:hypothetical protein
MRFKSGIQAGFRGLAQFEAVLLPGCVEQQTLVCWLSAYFDLKKMWHDRWQHRAQTIPPQTYDINFYKSDTSFMDAAMAAQSL